MTKDALILQLTFELYEAKSRLDKIAEMSSSKYDILNLIEINNICHCRTAWEDTK